MLYVFLCTDKTGHLGVRQEKPSSTPRLSRQVRRRAVRRRTFADDGTTMNGSLIILDLADLAEARAFAAGDPFAKAGLFESVSIRPWKKARRPA
jgi:hypothetical protein